MTDSGRHWHSQSFSLAADFVNALSLRGPIFFDEPDRRGWVFRGHANAEWPLLPSVARDLPTASVEDVAMPPWAPIVRREARLLRAFAELSDRGGLPVPNDSHRLRELLMLCADGDPTRMDAGTEIQYWPSEDVIPLMALAQHHGVSTRLLDWSYNPLVAAYFAAVEAARRPGANRAQGELCVWGLSPARIAGPQGIGRQATGGYRAPNHSYYQTVTVPTAGNPNLRAQAGVFLLCHHAALDEGTLFAPLEGAIGARSIDPLPTLVQLRLPVSEAGQVLWLLALRGIDGAALYPGYDGVRLGILERLAWRKPSD